MVETPGDREACRLVANVAEFKRAYDRFPFRNVLLRNVPRQEERASICSVSKTKLLPRAMKKHSQSFIFASLVVELIFYKNDN